MGSYEWQVYRMCILFYFNLQHEEKPLKWVYSWISNENWEKDVRVLTDKVFDFNAAYHSGKCLNRSKIWATRKHFTCFLLTSIWVLNWIRYIVDMSCIVHVHRCLCDCSFWSLLAVSWCDFFFGVFLIYSMCAYSHSTWSFSFWMLKLFDMLMHKFILLLKCFR